MEKSILFTQCLQNDFVKPIEKHEPLPNRLHVGYDEALRLLGEIPMEGPVNNVIRWAYATEEKLLKIIHIRDWHDIDSQWQKNHLTQFGHHCLKDTHGADFVFSQFIKKRSNDAIVHASGLNDFVDTGLAEILEPFKQQPVKVGIMGVWTEAKVQYLAYDLVSRYPNFQIAVCSALCASSSRTMHFISLAQIKNILGIEIFSSIGSFTKFLTGLMPEVVKAEQHAAESKIKPKDAVTNADDREILLGLFRNSKEIHLKVLDGGFSGNAVLKGEAVDFFGHREKATVVKIGPRDLIAKERMAFERIENVLGNNAPSIVDFAEVGERGGIKYRYASMLDEDVKSFQKYYAAEDDIEKIKFILKIVFQEHLGRLYDASKFEKLNLLEYYDFRAKYAPGVRKKVEAIIGKKAQGAMLEIAPGVETPNICNFYEEDLPKLREYSETSHYTAFLHGDLNGANIIIDGQNNVWLIDFFHTHQGHILKDLIKLENDILYIFMKIENQEEFSKATRLMDYLLDIHDLSRPLAHKLAFGNEKIDKAYRVIRFLRTFHAHLVDNDRDPYQLFTGIMRYSVHTMSFDEANEWQKKLALYTSGKVSQKIRESLILSKQLRIDFLATGKGVLDNIGITILPGRKDRNRELGEDLSEIRKNNISNVVCLVTDDELKEYGVPGLLASYHSVGLDTLHLPILDQMAPSVSKLKEALQWIRKKIENNEKVLIHCVGGLGRSGLVTACLLKEYAFTWEDAVDMVRSSRSKRAIENELQLAFVKSFS
jgi:protein-tyrosine phosphatase/nicotinamidase-related amidase